VEQRVATTVVVVLVVSLRENEKKPRPSAVENNNTPLCRNLYRSAHTNGMDIRWVRLLVGVHEEGHVAQERVRRLRT
jgi:hypothetical protein